ILKKKKKKNRPYLTKVYELKVKLYEEIPRDIAEVVKKSELYHCCEEVLKCILETIRILPQPLRQVIVRMKDRVKQSPSILLEWLLSVVFSPLLLNPDDWLVVIGNPSFSHDTAHNNIQAIVNQLMHIVVGLQSKQNNVSSADSITEHGQSKTSYDFTIDFNQPTTV
ncbi:hypothetical protein RFI_17517, partial [Reticulomyxa filosa]